MAYRNPGANQNPYEWSGSVDMNDMSWMPLFLTRTMQNCLFPLVELLPRSC